ncbi:MAG: hypothetical protein LBS33_07950 [Streptococcaceae bacterium]|jgi:hypothetical protein|nr:hypothetical protein [Streptococcaceae bacterium]
MIIISPPPDDDGDVPENPDSPTVDTTTFAGEEWLVLKKDTSTNAWLILRTKPLTNAEMNITEGGVNPNDRPAVRFLGGEDSYQTKTFFESENDNGYDRSNVKKYIDYYYKEFIAKDENNAAKVCKVNLNSKTFVTYKDQFGSTLAEYGTWSNDKYQMVDDASKDVSAVGVGGLGEQQAFALSFGDLRTLESTNDKGNSQYANSLIGTKLKEIYFWLRSPGAKDDDAGIVDKSDGAFSSMKTTDPNPKVVPALWILAPESK